MRLAGLVLMGGKSTRFGGKDKAFLPYKGRTFLEHILQSMSQLDTVYLSVARREGMPDLGYPLVEDIHPCIGPIGGIHAALRCCPEDALLVIACDMPNMSPAVVSLLVDAWERKPIPTIIQEADGQLCPTAAIYTQACLPVIEEMIKAQRYKIVELFSNITFQTVPLPATPNAQVALMNINSAEDYERL